MAEAVEHVAAAVSVKEVAAARWCPSARLETHAGTKNEGEHGWMIAEHDADTGGICGRVSAEEFAMRVHGIAEALVRGGGREEEEEKMDDIAVVYAAGCIEWVEAALGASAAGMSVAPINARCTGADLRAALEVLEKQRGGAGGGGARRRRLTLVADAPRLAKWKESGVRMPHTVLEIGPRTLCAAREVRVAASQARRGGGHADRDVVRKHAAAAKVDAGAPVHIHAGVHYTSIASLIGEKNYGSDSNSTRTKTPSYRFAPDEAAFLLFTSGTSGGGAKAAVLSHRALNAQSRAKLEHAEYVATDTYLNTAPLHHVGGLSSMLANLMAGARQVFVVPGAAHTSGASFTERKFDAVEVLRCCETRHITSLIAVPAMLFDMHRAFESGHIRSCSTVAKLLIGGGGLSRKLLESTARVFPNASVAAAYGMTEAASSITFTSAEEWCRRMPTSDSLVHEGGNFVGWPSSLFEVAVVAVANAPTHDTSSIRAHGGSVGVPGEILIRGQSVMSGYFNDEASSPWLRDGWFATGDIGIMHADGSLSLLGRLKDVIRVGSENVHAGDVEAVVGEADGVEAATVVGMLDARLGEVVGAMITLTRGWAWAEDTHETRGYEGDAKSSARQRRIVTPSSVRQFCRRAGLPGFKVPKVIVCAPGNALPTTALGKVVKQKVRQIMLARATDMPRPRL